MMQLSPDQRVGLYILATHLTEGGTDTVREMRLARSVRSRMNLTAEDIRHNRADGVTFEAGPIEADLTTGERELLRSFLEEYAETLRQKGNQVPKWLGAADEVLRPEGSTERSVRRWGSAALPLGGIGLFAAAPSMQSAGLLLCLVGFWAGQVKGRGDGWRSFLEPASYVFAATGLLLSLGSLAAL